MLPDTMWLYIPATLIAAVAIRVLFGLAQNYWVARRIGVPVMVSFAAPFYPLNMIFGKALRRLTMHCPWPVSEWWKYSFYGWSFFDQGRIHEKLGPAFVNVTPYRNVFVVADPAAIVSALTRYRQFQKIPGIKSMEIFGPNINTVEGDVWARHKKLTSPAFNEKCSRLVWQESLKQANGMLQKSVAAGTSGSNSLGIDVQTIAMHVLARVGFGNENDFGEGVSKVDPGYTLPFRDTISLILRSTIWILILGKKKLRSSIMPQSFQKVGLAIEEYDRYAESLLEKERKASSQNNLMSALVKASDSEKDSGRHSQTLTDEEILGNVFLFIIAGHDTTANTLGFAIVMLAVHPEIQDWLSEETNAVLGNDKNPDYEEAYPKLVRCLATMYETLRLFSAVPENPKYIWSSPVPLTVSDKEYLIPPDTFVQLNKSAVFCSSKYFGPDPLTWRPNRFIIPPNSSSPTPPNPPPSSLSYAEGETVWDPPKGTYIPFSDGPRNCLGSKFAKVEFVAVIATLFGKFRVSPKQNPGESVGAARKRAEAMAKDAWTGGVALKMREPGRVGMVWERR